MLSVLIFLGLTVDSHRQFGELTNADKITEEVKMGQAAWHKNNCINCHTIFGEGAYYAPDLTKITQHRGDAYLTAYLRDPSQFYDEKRHRRLMPQQDLSEADISNLIAFLDWVSNVDNNGWPPRPILVTGSGMPGGGIADAPTSQSESPAGAASSTANAGNNPIALGEQVFKTATPSCTACHSTLPDVNMAGPSLAGVTSRVEELLASEDYSGQAEDLQGYLRESIVAPSAYLVPGSMFSAGGTSFMPPTYEDLTTEQVDQLVAYLSSFK